MSKIGRAMFVKDEYSLFIGIIVKDYENGQYFLRSIYDNFPKDRKTGWSRYSIKRWNGLFIDTNKTHYKWGFLDINPEIHHYYIETQRSITELSGIDVKNYNLNTGAESHIITVKYSYYDMKAIERFIQENFYSFNKFDPEFNVFLNTSFNTSITRPFVFSLLASQNYGAFAYGDDTRISTKRAQLKYLSSVVDYSPDELL